MNIIFLLGTICFFYYCWKILTKKYSVIDVFFAGLFTTSTAHTLGEIIAIVKDFV